MIELKNISITFDKKLIEDASICLPDGQVTVITGESGCGKTSLLYLIGLLSSNSSYQYFFDGSKIDLHAESETSQIRKQRIGYVFQDNSLINTLTIGENIRFAAQVAGIRMSDMQIKQYLKGMKLNLDLKNYPKMLSGGEQQRLAIACAMAKQPDLIIADEPTSALDEANIRLIMEMLRNYAHGTDRKVVIASHNGSVCREADVVYKIENKKIQLVSTKNAHSAPEYKTSAPKSRNRIGWIFYFQHSLKTLRKSKFQTSLMIFLCAISISFTISIRSLGVGLVDQQKNALNNLSDREVFVVNFTAPLATIINTDEHLSITKEDANQIQRIANIEKCYPYIEFRSVGYDIEKSDFLNSGTILVEKDSEKQQFEFNSFAEDEYNSLVVIPYYPEQNLKKRTSCTFLQEESNPVYLSYQLASLIGVNDERLSSVKISFEIGVPVYTTDVELSVGREAQTYAADIDLMVKQNLHFDVAGVLESNYNNHYSSSGDNVIYVPFSVMQQIMANSFSKALDIRADESVKRNELAPSAYMVYVKSYNDIGIVIDKITRINPNFKSVSSYQDTEAMNSLVDGVKSTATTVILVVLAIVLILMSIIYINRTLGRQYEIAILKANGLNKAEILKIELAEACLHVAFIAGLALVLSAAEIRILNLLFSFDVTRFTFGTALAVLLIALFSVIVPSIGSVIIVNRVKPDKLLRN